MRARWVRDALALGAAAAVGLVHGGRGEGALLACAIAADAAAAAGAWRRRGLG